MPPIDVERYRVRHLRSGSSSQRPPRPLKGQHYLKGPIPLPWLETAANLPGRALHAGIALWYAAGLIGSASVPLSNLASLRFGIDRSSKYRALRVLEGAGLIRVERKLGRSPQVTIVMPDAEARP